MRIKGESACFTGKVHGSTGEDACHKSKVHRSTAKDACQKGRCNEVEVRVHFL